MKFGFIDFTGEFRTFDTVEELTKAAEAQADAAGIVIELWSTFGRTMPEPEGE